MPFEDWNVGEELFSDLDKEHDLLDRDVRPFAEECDQMRAIQIFASADDAWGGFTARYIDRLRDEYGKKSIWVWAIEDGARVQRVWLTFQDFNEEPKSVTDPDVASSNEERCEQGQVTLLHLATIHTLCAHHRRTAETPELRQCGSSLALAANCLD